MTDRICANCTHKETRATIKVLDSVFNAVCLRYPPIVLTDGAVAYPSINDQWRCGEFAPSAEVLEAGKLQMIEANERAQRDIK